MIVRNIFHLIRRAGIEVWPVWESEWLTHGRNVNRLAGAVGLASVASGGHIRMPLPPHMLRSALRSLQPQARRLATCQSVRRTAGPVLGIGAGAKHAHR